VTGVQTCALPIWLAQKFGPPFSTALDRGRAVAQGDFSDDATVSATCRAVLEFQAERLRDVFKEDEETAEYASDSAFPEPAVVFAPYFYIEPHHAKAWIAVNHRLALGATTQNHKLPVHLVICGHLNLLTDRALSDTVIGNLLECRPPGVWLWFSRFDERFAEREQLAALRRWVEALSPAMSVFNMHGGYFSLALSKFGMAGTAHGIGYGEQKDVIPVIGQSTPTVQYYLRALHSKYSVLQIQRSFSRLGVRTTEDFFAKICECPICRGIIDGDLDNFSQFGEIHYSTPKSKRAAQTPAAAKRCRYHFLRNRIIERDYVAKATLGDIIAQWTASADQWSRTAAIGTVSEHLRDWAEVLSAHGSHQ